MIFKEEFKNILFEKIHPGHILRICCLFSFCYIRDKMLGNEIMVNGGYPDVFPNSVADPSVFPEKFSYARG